MSKRLTHPVSRSDTTEYRTNRPGTGAATKRKPASRSIPPPTAVIPLPKLDQSLATLVYSSTGLPNSLLARAGLWISRALSKTRCGKPGPWGAQTRPDRIQVELAGWIKGMFDEICSASFGNCGHEIGIGKLESSGSLHCGMMIDHPIDCNAIFCDVLPQIGKADLRLEAVVVAALQTLTWVKPYYTYDDQIESCLDLYEQDRYEMEKGSEDEKYFQERLQWLQNGIPQKYRFLFRGKDKPVFPELPPPPPDDSWLYRWHLWAEEVREISTRWTRPIREEAPAGDYYDDNFYPELLTPLLWSTSDPLVEAFDQEAQGYYENCLGSKSVFPLKSVQQVSEVLTDLKQLGECYRLHLKACSLARPSLAQGNGRSPEENENGTDTQS